MLSQGNNSSNIPDNADMIYLSPKSKVLFSELSKYVTGKEILLVSFNEKDKKNVMIITLLL